MSCNASRNISCTRKQRGRERGVGIGQKEREFKIEIDTFVSLTLSSFVVNPFCVPSATRQDKECECESECECVWRI